MPRDDEGARILEALRDAGAKGMTRRELMARLGIAETTVKRHLKRLGDRLEEDVLAGPPGVAGRPQKVYYVRGARR